MVLSFFWLWDSVRGHEDGWGSLRYMISGYQDVIHDYDLCIMMYRGCIAGVSALVRLDTLYQRCIALYPDMYRDTIHAADGIDGVSEVYRRCIGGVSA